MVGQIIVKDASETIITTRIITQYLIHKGIYSYRILRRQYRICFKINETYPLPEREFTNSSIKVS